MYLIPETFEIEQIFTHIKKNKHTNFEFYFCNQLSDAYKNRLETIIDEIIEAENHEYKIPYFHCGEIAPQKQNKLYQLYHNL
uniref:Uncharacterized protein n=1 Tax=Panagrolaimus superbus TaxID=310955 RepID=A0A914XYD5_9BILA